MAGGILDLLGTLFEFLILIGAAIALYVMWRMPDELWEEMVRRPEDFAERITGEDPKRRERKTSKSRGRSRRRRERSSSSRNRSSGELDRDTDGIDRLRD
jgi:hypothetical protein